MPKNINSGSPKEDIHIGVSSCLIGHKVRFDGGHKKDRFISNQLEKYFKLIHFCPEIEAGMGVPRETVSLIGSIENISMVGSKTGIDWTDRVNRVSNRQIKRLQELNLCGYVLKKKSPSCGMERVKLPSNNTGAAQRIARGLFAERLIQAFPLLPVEEEDSLNDPSLRENFIVRVFAYHRLNSLFNSRFNRGNMIKFHASHKYLLMAHSVKQYRLLGKLTARIKDYEPMKFKKEYGEMFMAALSIKTTVKKNVNVLLHIFGYMKKLLSAEDKKYLLREIDDYHKELTPLIVPITLIRRYVDKFGLDYIREQVYISPHPNELTLRNHV